MKKEVFISCLDKIKPYIHKTPVLTSTQLNDMAGCKLYFKCENFQKMGAFKMRGSLNAILNLSQDKLKKGVVTHSSGNFAQAVSLASKLLDVKAYIIMPSNAPQVKINAVKGYGGEVILCNPTIKDREDTAQKTALETGATFLHPSNDIDVIVGQGTSALELIQDYPYLNIIVTPVGGGGLISGTSLVAHHFGSSCITIGAEPAIVDDAYRALISGKIELNTRTDTIADGLRTHLGTNNFPIIQKYVEKIIRVEESEIITAMKLIWERMKIVIEPSSAVAFAAVLKDKQSFQGKNIGIILSGGNVDLLNLPFTVEAHMA
jgi:threonine dehydratase